MRDARQAETLEYATHIHGDGDEYVLSAARVGPGYITWSENLVLPPPST